jgi:4-amino-4-deoxy-L-arabinose transferase-like glycosyltransferase
MIQAMRRHGLLFVILFLYFVLGSLYAVQTPAWQTPDEPAHYNVVRQMANGRLPVIEPGDYDQAYIMEVVFSTPAFAPEYALEPMSYEDWQPPLYYLLQTPLFLATDGSLTTMRLLSLVLGAGVVVLAYVLAWQLFPEQKWLALTTAVFTAFLPQHLAIMASANNDALAELIIAAVLVVLVCWIQLGDWRVETGDSQSLISNLQSPSGKYLFALGVLLGLGFITKGTVYPLALIVALTVLWRFWGQWRDFVRAALLVAIPAFALGLLWWVRNVFVYGGLDMLGKAAHDSVVVGQPRTAEWIADMGLSTVLNAFVTTTFDSFWGQFGWMTHPMDSRFYLILWLFTLVWMVGFVIALVVWWNRKQPPTAAILVLLGTFVLTLAVQIVYNFTFVQHQGRYLFPALLPISVGVSVGLGFWLRPFYRRWVWLKYSLPLGLGLLMLALNAWVITRLLPQL